jgi:hypothetical protein
MTGRRVDSLGDLTQEGDYVLCRGQDNEITALWMKLPRTETQGRIPAAGHGVDGEAEWTIVENASGTVTVLPSIDEGSGGYHGFLTDGIWSDG